MIVLNFNEIFFLSAAWFFKAMVRSFPSVNRRRKPHFKFTPKMPGAYNLEVKMKDWQTFHLSSTCAR